MSYLVKESRRPAVTAIERARRQSERGDERRAMLILREACFAAELEPGLWVHYGLRACAPAAATKAFAPWLTRSGSANAAAISVAPRSCAT